MSEEPSQTNRRSEKKGSEAGPRRFFTSLPGIMTGIAALLTATVGLLTFLGRGDGEGDGPPDEWTARVNLLCISAGDRIDAIQLLLTPDGLPNWSVFYADHSDVMEGLVEDFKEVSVPSGQETRAATLIELWSNSGDRFLQASVSTTEQRRNLHADAGYDSIIQAGELASEVGALACTDLPKD